jgi:hypothetical protein
MSILLAAVLLAALALIVTLAVVRRVFPTSRLATHVLRCPLEDRAAAARFVESTMGERRFDVARCSIFAPSAAVTCAKRCVKPLAPAV